MSYTGQLFDQGGAVFNLATFYNPATTTDHTPALQAAIDAAANAGRGTVLIPPGSYSVTNIQLKPGITISGYGATLNKPVSVSPLLEFKVRNGNQQLPGWGGPVDSELLTIEGLTLNGNSSQQVGYRTYGTEEGAPNEFVQQYHMIMLNADPYQAGRLRVVLRDLVVRNGVADGISLYTNVDAQIINCRVDDCWRSGLAITGGNTRCQIQNLITTGFVDRTGIDIEVDGAGYDPASTGVDQTPTNFAVHVTVDGMDLDGDADVILPFGSTFLATNIRAGAPFLFGSQRSTMRISNSEFSLAAQSVTSDPLNRILFPHDVTFSNCTFTVRRPPGATGAQELSAVHVAWNNGGTTEEHQRLRLVNCVWKVAGPVDPGDQVNAVVTEWDVSGRDNRLIVTGGHIQAGFQTGFVMKQGGQWIIKDTRIDAARAFSWNGVVNPPYSNSPAEIRIERVDVSGAAAYMHVVTAQAFNVLDQRDVVVEQGQNVLTAGQNGLAGNEYRGGRIIRVDDPPSATNLVAGIVGDVARLRTPVAGSPYEWVCTASSTTAATWKAKPSLSA